MPFFLRILWVIMGMAFWGNGLVFALPSQHFWRPSTQPFRSLFLAQNIPIHPPSQSPTSSWPSLPTQSFATPGYGNPKDQWDLADRLFANGEYYRSVTENLRFVYFYPQHPRAQDARLRVVEAHLLGREPKRALYWLRHWLNNPQPAKTTQTPPLERALRANWIWLEALAHLELATQNYYALQRAPLEKSLALLTGIPNKTPKKVPAKQFVQAWQTSQFASQEKSPLLAGMLSVLFPGSGSIYLNRFGEGTLTFLVVGVLAASSVEAQHKNASGLAFGLGLGALAFYGGGVYSAVNGAHRHNDGLRVNVLAKLRKKHFLHLRPAGWTVFSQRF